LLPGWMTTGITETNLRFRYKWREGITELNIRFKDQSRDQIAGNIMRRE
jgi:hypothetical protein